MVNASFYIVLLKCLIKASFDGSTIDLGHFSIRKRGQVIFFNITAAVIANDIDNSRDNVLHVGIKLKLALLLYKM
jgi:hypothetical protein